MSHTVAGYACIVLAACFWGGSSSLGKHLLQAGVSTVTLTEARTVVSALVVLATLGAVARPRLRIRRGDVPLLLLSGVGLALVNLFYYEAVKRLPIATAVFIQFTAPAMVFAWGLATGRERPRVATTAALLLSTAGTYLMVGGALGRGAPLPFAGVLAAVGSAVTYAACILISHRLARRLPAATIVTYSWCVSALVWSLVQSVPDTVGALVRAEVVAPVLLFAFTSMLIPLPLFTVGIGRVSATGGAIASSTETVAASMTAFLVLGEALTAGQAVGGALILAAVGVLASRRQAADA